MAPTLNVTRNDPSSVLEALRVERSERLEGGALTITRQNVLHT